MSQTFDVVPCPVCSSTDKVYLFEVQGYSVWACKECNLTFSSNARSETKNNHVAHWQYEPQTIRTLADGVTEVEASKKYLQRLVSRGDDIKNIMLVAEHGHCFAELAVDQGINVEYHVTIDEIEEGIDLSRKVDAIVVIYQLEKSKAIDLILDKMYMVLRSGGELFMVILSLDSLSANFFGQSWIGWRPENKYYFDNTNIQLILWRFGFNEVWLEKDMRLYTLAHISERASGFPETWVTRTISALYNTMPESLHGYYFRLPSSGVIITARKSERRIPATLSVVMPVYNESLTFPTLMEQLLALELIGIKKEIIVVESNSQDNSRELVLNYINHPEVKVVLQEKPRGKGHAVREGMEYATGDILLIQDADLEYDLNDYPALLEPVQMFKTPFVLGARRGGRWKMRHFSDQVQLSTYFNLGHVLFTLLLNVLYGQRMKDPFTMFKVFRRDCLHNLKFECDRFDFDFELVIKLLRKGYTPLEIPVNYFSRSFKEGKKVDMFRDPFTWIRASFKYRFAKITKDGSKPI